MARQPQARLVDRGTGRASHGGRWERFFLLVLTRQADPRSCFVTCEESLENRSPGRLEMSNANRTD